LRLDGHGNRRDRLFVFDLSFCFAGDRAAKRERGFPVLCINRGDGRDVDETGG